MAQYPILSEPIKTRHLIIKIVLDKSCFLSSGTNEIIFKDLTMEATIVTQTGFVLPQANVIIYGLSLATIQSLSKINIYGITVPENKIYIYAGYVLDANGFPPLAFIGEIYNAGADLNNPDYPMQISASSCVFGQNLTNNNTSVKGVIAIENLLKSIISQMQGYTYIGKGVKGMIKNPNYSGSYVSQLQQICDDYGYKLTISNNRVFVTSMDDSEDSILTISVDNYLIHRPKLSEFGVDIVIWYTPSVEFLQKINLKSIYGVANGEWYINAIVTTLQNRGVKWESLLRLNNVPARLELKDDSQ